MVVYLLIFFIFYKKWGRGAKAPSPLFCVAFAPSLNFLRENFSSPHTYIKHSKKETDERPSTVFIKFSLFLTFHKLIVIICEKVVQKHHTLHNIKQVQE